MDKSLILWSDEAVLAVNKPAGLRSIPDGYDRSLPYLSGELEKDFGRVWVVHRLDKDTSGMMLFARSPEAHRALNSQFEQHAIRKEYHAILIGVPEWEEIRIALPLRINGDRRHRTVIDHQTGKPAVTVAQLHQRLGIFSLAIAQPQTGLTHQIRAHLAAVGFPLLRDSLYHSLEPETQVQAQAKKLIPGLPLQRLALHALKITFIHPSSGEEMSLEAPYPEDFAATLTRLASDA